MAKHGLFVGLVTLDCIYLTNKLPEKNQKLVAEASEITSGGPATNAAVAFAYLGRQAKLLGVLGTHPITPLIQADLAAQTVGFVDLDPTRVAPPPVSSIMVTQPTGERAVISINAKELQADCDRIPADILDGVEIMLVDGHQLAVSLTLVQQAQARSIPVVLDGGSWKPGLDQILPYVDYAICSADFYPPGCHTPEAVIEYLRATMDSRQALSKKQETLQAIAPTQIAITNGHQPIQAVKGQDTSRIPVPQATPRDTLGAGDVFHGAFCYFILEMEFEPALSEAAKVATYSCEFFGTRAWLQSIP